MLGFTYIFTSALHTLASPAPLSVTRFKSPVTRFTFFTYIFTSALHARVGSDSLHIFSALHALLGSESLYMIFSDSLYLHLHQWSSVTRFIYIFTSSLHALSGSPKTPSHFQVQPNPTLLGFLGWSPGETANTTLLILEFWRMKPIFFKL